MLLLCRLRGLHYIAMNGSRTQAKPWVKWGNTSNVPCLLCHGEMFGITRLDGATGGFPKSPASSSCFPQVPGVKVTPLDMRFMANSGKSEKPYFDHPYFWPGAREEFYQCRHAVLE